MILIKPTVNRLTLAVLALICIGFGSCPDSGLTGRWEGTATGTNFSTGKSSTYQMSLSLIQNDASLKGTWALADGRGSGVSGTLTGRLDGNGISLDLRGSDCPMQAVGTWEGSRIQALWSAYDCGSKRSGELDLLKK